MPACCMSDFVTKAVIITTAKATTSISIIIIIIIIFLITVGKVAVDVVAVRHQLDMVYTDWFPEVDVVISLTWCTQTGSLR